MTTTSPNALRRRWRGAVRSSESPRADIGVQALAQVAHLHLQGQRAVRMLGAAHGQAAQLGQVFQLAAGLGQAADPALARGQAQFQLFESVEQLLDQPAMPGKVGWRLA